MPSNHVEEARDGENAWLEYFSTELVGMWALMSMAEREHAEVSFFAGYKAAIEQERSRYEGLLASVVEWATTETGWCKACVETVPCSCPVQALRAALTPSAPAEKEG